MLKTAPFSTRPLYLQVRDLLVARIVAGEWRPGGTLPNEVDLARELSVSPGTVRRALEEMRNVRYTATIDDITPTNFGAQAYGAIPDFPTFRRVVDIQNNTPEANCLPAPPMPCTKTVTVSIFYRDERGQEQSVALRTIFVR